MKDKHSKQIKKLRKQNRKLAGRLQLLEALMYNSPMKAPEASDSAETPLPVQIRD